MIDGRGKKNAPQATGVAKVLGANDYQWLEGEFSFRVSLNEHPLLSFIIVPSKSAGGFPPGPLSLAGQTHDGRRLSAEPVYFSGSTISSSGSEIRFTATRVVIGEEDPCDRFELRFPNFLFMGSEYTEEANQDGRLMASLDKFRATFTTGVGEVAFEVKHVPGYKEAENRITKQRSREITAVGNLASTQEELLEPYFADEVGTELSWLIGFATGRLCGYTHLLGFCGQSPVFTRYLDARYGLKTGFVPVLPDMPGWLPKFLEQTYGPFCRILATDKGKYLVQAIGSYINALELPTFPIPVYLTAYSLDCLINGFLDANATSFLERKEHKKVSISFRQWAQANVLPLIGKRSQELAQEFEDVIRGKADGLLRRPFGALVEALLKKFDIPYEQKDISAFVKLRNAGIHGKFIPEQEFINVWARATQWVELAILRRLEYEGEYVDRTDMGKWTGETKPLPWRQAG